jgi:hypothetical protein
MASVSIDLTAEHTAAALLLFGEDTQTRLTIRKTVAGESVDMPKTLKELTSKQLLSYLVERALRPALEILARNDDAPLIAAKQARDDRRGARQIEDDADIKAIADAAAAIPGTIRLVTLL